MLKGDEFPTNRHENYQASRVYDIAEVRRIGSEAVHLELSNEDLPATVEHSPLVQTAAFLYLSRLRCAEEDMESSRVSRYIANQLGNLKSFFRLSDGFLKGDFSLDDPTFTPARGIAGEALAYLALKNMRLPITVGSLGDDLRGIDFYLSVPGQEPLGFDLYSGGNPEVFSSKVGIGREGITPLLLLPTATSKAYSSHTVSPIIRLMARAISDNSSNVTRNDILYGTSVDYVHPFGTDTALTKKVFSDVLGLNRMILSEMRAEIYDFEISPERIQQTDILLKRLSNYVN